MLPVNSCSLRNYLTIKPVLSKTFQLIMVNSARVFSQALTKVFNNSVNIGSFPVILNSGKHYLPKLKTFHQYDFLRIKSKLGAVIGVSVRFAKRTSLMRIILRFFLLHS